MIQEKILLTQVCKHSIIQTAKRRRPLRQQELRDAGWYTRPNRQVSTQQNLHLHVFPISELTNFPWLGIVYGL